MLSSFASIALLGAAVSAAPAPFTFPLPNGFPDIKVPSPALLAIEEQAHGTLPNAPLLKTLSPTDILNWQVVAFNEIFEVGYFTSLYEKISGGTPGYEVGTAAEKKYALEAIDAIIGQEELHALGANAIIATAGGTPIEPCKYVFPDTDYESAIDFARTFTDLVVGTLQAVQFSHAVEGDEEYIPLIGSVIGQESEQIGFFRQGLGVIPSELPFLTGSAGVFAYSALNQLVVVPDSCPNSDIITQSVPILGALTLETPVPIAPKDQNLAFSFESDASYSADFSLVYINQQNLPIVEKPLNVKEANGVVSFEAALPYTEYIMNGLTIAAVTSTAGPFATPDDVAAVALYGPALIEIN